MQDNERYSLTLKALIWSALNDNLVGQNTEKITNDIVTQIELYCRRHGVNAALFIGDNNEFTGGDFVEVKHD